jgi:hypothetical protein
MIQTPDGGPEIPAMSENTGLMNLPAEVVVGLWWGKRAPPLAPGPGK